MRFNKLYEELFKPATPEELRQRREQYNEISKKEVLENFLNQTEVTQNSDGTIDVNGSVLFDADFYNFNNSIVITFNKIPFKFNRVEGNFDCSDNELISLEGAPTYVGGSFNCSDNQLTSLKGCPIEVGRNFDCYNNFIKSLNGAPSIINGSFYCYDNQLTSLEGAPDFVLKSFDISENPGPNGFGFDRDDILEVIDIRGEIFE